VLLAGGNDLAERPDYGVPPGPWLTPVAGAY
jgi:hypothetical protein